jgi:glycosyltransferase involved in cell wall biosynthesis
MASPLRRIAIDLTPLQPGEAIGETKPFALSLIRAMAENRPQTSFTWLSLQRTEEELLRLAMPNVSVCCTDKVQGGARAWVDRLLSAFGRTAPPAGDVMFCPFTAPYRAWGGVPVVSLIHDLSSRAYPEFFDESDRAQLDGETDAAVRRATRLVVRTEFLRGEVIKCLRAPAENVAVVPDGIPGRLGSPDPHKVPLGLAPGSYYLYPEDYWPHKNHKMLLVAAARLRDLKLVLAGAPGARADEIGRAIQLMRLGDRVVQAGSLTHEERLALLGSARAVIFPSLYEGAAPSVLRAMELGVPVLCSDRTALPEIAGAAALLFDPRNPDTVAGAVRRFEEEPGLAEELSRRGRAKAAEFGDMGKMAARYFAELESALAAGAIRQGKLDGVWGDRWTDSRFKIKFAAESAHRELELDVLAPSCLPHDEITVRWGREVMTLPRGAQKKLQMTLPSNAKEIEFRVSPVFVQPAPETRRLGCQVLGCRVLGETPAELV